MIELLIKPKHAERKPWQMFFVGAFYAAISFLIVNFIFSKDSILGAGSGLLMVGLTVFACFPFVYYLIKLEEGKDLEISRSGKILKEHSKAIFALCFMFLGFLLSFSLGYMLFPQTAGQNFNFQIGVYCAINYPSSMNSCLNSNGVSFLTGNATGGIGTFVRILSNNISVLIFTVLFSLLFGAGAIFILVWNASVIAGAIGIFAKGNLFSLPVGFFRYLIHGIPEIAAYFVGALAGGIISVAIIRKDLSRERKWIILQDALVLTLIAVIILIIASLIEVYVTPIFF